MVGIALGAVPVNNGWCHWNFKGGGAVATKSRGALPTLLGQCPAGLSPQFSVVWLAPLNVRAELNVRSAVARPSPLPQGDATPRGEKAPPLPQIF